MEDAPKRLKKDFNLFEPQGDGRCEVEKGGGCSTPVQTPLEEEIESVPLIVLPQRHVVRRRQLTLTPGSSTKKKTFHFHSSFHLNSNTH